LESYKFGAAPNSRNYNLRKEKIPLLPTPSSEITIHPFSEGYVLYLIGSRNIWVLNTTSAFIWCQLDDVANIDELTDRFSSTFHISKSKAYDDVRIALTEFEKEGLFNTKADDGNSGNDWDITPIGPPIRDPNSWAVGSFFRVANHLFEFRCQNNVVGESFTANMHHFETINNETPNTRLSVIASAKEKDKLDIFLDDRGFSLKLADDEVLPHLMTLIFVRSCESLKDHLLFHAAVIEKEGTTVMFPGEAGSGKTTLVAALLRSGCWFYSDELAVINIDDLNVFPLPLPMSIKPGSVGPLEPYYPGLFNRQIYLRSDGKKVRYISPSSHDLPLAKSSTKVDYLIFPKYCGDAGNKLVEIDKTEALQRLALTGSSNRNFTDRDVKAMISLIDENPCYELAYSDLSHAVSKLNNDIFMC
jgi:hypothetical protein